MKGRVVFQTNVPVKAALVYGDGIKVEGRYGDQVVCTCRTVATRCVRDGTAATGGSVSGNLADECRSEGNSLTVGA